MFVSEEGSPRIEQMRARNSVLLALYEGVHLNRNFIATLSHYQADAQPSPQPTPQLSTPSSSTSQHPSQRTPVAASSASAPTTPTTPPVLMSNGEPVTAAATTPPSNLLVTFLEYCSIVMQVRKKMFASLKSLTQVRLRFFL